VTLRLFKLLCPIDVADILTHQLLVQWLFIAFGLSRHLRLFVKLRQSLQEIPETTHTVSNPKIVLTGATGSLRSRVLKN